MHRADEGITSSERHEPGRKGRVSCKRA